MKNIYIVAQEFQWPSNCGALARVIANFGFNRLVFLNPKCNHKGGEAIKYSKHAKELLKKAAIIKSFSQLLKSFDYVIATTSMLGTDYNIPRSPVNPEQLAKLLERKGNKKVAIIIGREGEGMSNEEIRKCDFVVTIPTSKKYPTMNVSHAAAVILYELSKHTKERKIGRFNIAGAEEKKALLKLLDRVLKKTAFLTEQKRDTQRLIWKRLLGKSFLTKREANALFGFFKKFDK